MAAISRLQVLQRGQSCLLDSLTSNVPWPRLVGRRAACHASDAGAALTASLVRHDSASSSQPRPRHLPQCVQLPLPHRRLSPRSVVAAAGCRQLATEAEAPASDLEKEALLGLEDLVKDHRPLGALEKMKKDRKLGGYRENQTAWNGILKEWLEVLPEYLNSLGSDWQNEEMDIKEYVELVDFLACDLEVTAADFWDRLTVICCWAEDSRRAGLPRARKASKMLSPIDAKNVVPYFVELTRLYTIVRSWSEACEVVYEATWLKVNRDDAVHYMPPEYLTSLVDSFTKAGSHSQRISFLARRLITETEERIIADVHEFEVLNDPRHFKHAHLMSLVTSLARIQLRRASMLEHMGRESLHKEKFQGWPCEEIISICQSYGQLGWRHDTVFKDVAAEILAENVQLQRDQALGRTNIPVPKYSSASIAVIAQAMLILKMHRGNTSWCKWQDNYQELLDILQRRMVVEMETWPAKPLAAAAWILGRARRGTDEVCQALYTRMIKILEATDLYALEVDENPPQYELARFFWGLAMMHPVKKDLDVQWFLKWLCSNYFTMPLSDVISINRHLVQMRCIEPEYLKDYLKAFETFLCDRVPDMRKADIIHITETYNGAQIRDEDFERGRHLFWALGRRMQSLRAEGAPMRARYERMG